MKEKKFKLSFIFAVLAILLFSSITVFAAQNTPNTKRLSGADRYATSAAVALSGWTQSNYAILASGENFPDAISAAPLAKKYDAPILLSEANSIPAETLNAIQQLKVKNIIIIGGTGSISAAVEKQLASLGIAVTRIFGQDRYETCIKVAEQLDNVTEIAVVTGESFPDALSISPIAVKRNMPIILVSHNEIPSVVKYYINSHKLTTTYVIGSGTSLNNTVLKGLSNIELVTGADKYQINLNIIDKFKSDLNLGTVYAASGEGFADALSGSILAGKNSSPLLLIGNDPSTEKNYFANNSINISNINVLGGIGVVPDEVINKFTGTTTTSSAISTPPSTITVDEIDFPSMNLIKTGTNTATFKYKILDKSGTDITKIIPASDIYAISSVGLPNAPVSLNPSTGTGTITYNFSSTDEEATVAMMYENGVAGTSTLYFNPSKAEEASVVKEIDFVTTRSSKIGINTAAFNYKILNKFGTDITKIIPNSEITSTASLDSSITLDPKTGTGTIQYKSSSDIGKPITITLVDKVTGIKVNAAFDADGSPRLSKIAITSTILATSNVSGVGSGVGYAIYKVEDQYGDDITCSSFSNNITFNCNVGTVKAQNGLLIVNPNADVNFMTLNSVVITASDSTTGISTSAKLIIDSK